MTYRTSLSEALYEANLTFTDMARALDVSVGAVSLWALGKRAPQPERLHRANAWMRAQGVNTDLAWGELLPPSATHATPRPRSPLRLVEANDSTTQGPPPGPPDPPDEPPNPPEVLMVPRSPLSEEALKYFNLPADPFEDVPDQMWLSPKLAELERQLWLAMERRQMVVLTGEPGSGKSTMVRRFIAAARRRPTVKVVVPYSLNRKQITPDTLSVAMVRDLAGKNTATWDREARAELLDNTLMVRLAEGQNTCLVIDEAHDLSTNALIGIKRVWDTHSSAHPMAVLLVGQPPLHARLTTDPSLKEVTLRSKLIPLKPLTAAEVSAYLGWRWSTLGSTPAPFTADACKALAKLGQHPLAINNLASLALTCVMQAAERQVTAAHIGQM